MSYALPPQVTRAGVPTVNDDIGAGFVIGSQIINTASAAAFSCAPTMAAYNMTKAAVLALSETLHGELMDHNIHVSCIMPTYFKTNVIQHARGGELVKKATEHFIKKSGLEAIDVAAEILERAGKKNSTLSCLPLLGKCGG